MTGESRVSTYRFGRWEIDLSGRELRSDGLRIPLGSRAFDIIEVLVQAPGALVSKDELARIVWPGAFVDDNTLQVHISAVRRALGSDRGLIKTASGRGYRLLGAWTPEHEAATGEVDALDLARTATGPPQGNLPIAATELIGREEARRQVVVLLTAHRVVTLTGPGGIGKTRLGVAIAYNVRPDFSDGAWFVDLSPLSDASLVPSAAAGAIGLDLQAADFTPTRVARAISDKQLLIVLDNCEHVIDAAAQLADTIARICPRVSILATSREPLRIEAEGVYRVPPLDLPADDRAASPELLQHSAVQLFVTRAQGWDPRLGEQSAGIAMIAAICRHLDGIPFAIELAAASAATLGLEATLRQLDDRFHLLTGGRRTAPVRQRTLLATLNWSYDLLSEFQRIILRRLGVFAGGFTLDAACAVVATEEMQTRQIVAGVADLAMKSFITVDTNGDVTRYFLMETTRAYAIEKLAASVETERVMRRHAEFYMGLMAQAQAEREQRPAAEWIETYRREFDNVRTALDWAFSPHGDASIAVMLCTVSIRLMYDLSLVEECHRRAEKALQLVGAGVQPDPRCEMHLLTVLQASRTYTEGISSTSFDAWQTVLRLATLHDDAGYQARALWGLWNDNLYGGSPAEALVFARRFTDLARTRRDTAKIIMGQRITGISLHYCGRQPEAREQLEQVLARYVRAIHQWPIFGGRLDQGLVTRATLARTLFLQGEPDRAARLSVAAVSDAVAEEHLIAALYVLVEAGVPVCLATGDVASTERFLATLLEQAARSGFRIWRTCARCFQEVLRVRGGDYQAGLPRLADAIQDLRDTGFLAQISMFLGVLANGHMAAGRPEIGLATIDGAIERAKNHDDGWYFPELLRIKGEIILRLHARDAHAAAATLFRQAMVLADSQGALAWTLRAVTSLARLLQQQGHADQAHAEIAPVYDRFTEGFDTPDLRAARSVLGNQRTSHVECD